MRFQILVVQLVQDCELLQTSIKLRYLGFVRSQHEHAVQLIKSV